MKKALLFFIVFSHALWSQNITNTLGTSGLFSIKDGSSTYFSLSQSTGYLSLSRSLQLPITTNSATGVIYKGVDRFMHDYQGPGTTGLNTFIGINSGNFSMSGFIYEASENTALGYNTLNSLTTGYRNIAIGPGALHLNSIGTYNIAIGVSTLGVNWAGVNNVGIGHHSLNSNTTGSANIALGTNTLSSNTTGNYNTVLGMDAMLLNTTGSNNTCIGLYSMYSNRTAQFNTALGESSLYNNTIGSSNTALGYRAGYLVTTGSNLIMIGNNVQPTSATISNQITLGNNLINSLRCNVTTITSLSDSRDKKNITDLQLGLDFISKLKPRLFNWDKREWYEENIPDGSKMQETPTAGFIAQELDDIQRTENAEWLNLVLKDNPEKWEATPGNLLPVMIKAIQELKAENDKLKNENVELKERLSKLEQLQLQIVNEIEKMKSKNSEVKEVKVTEK